ncbi:MAG: hypothetical protein ACI4V6_04555 [Dorea sp.]
MCVNSSEKRRQKLLEQTRRMYSDREIPAIHPRYGAIYDQLYPEAERDPGSGSLGFRLLLCILLFVCYVSMDYMGKQVINVSSDRIAEEIAVDVDVAEVWKQL